MDVTSAARSLTVVHCGGILEIGKSTVHRKIPTSTLIDTGHRSAGTGNVE